MVIGSGVECGGHHQLRPKRGNFLVDVGFAEMVYCWGIRAPKRCTRYLLCGAGFGGGTKGSGGHTVGGSQCEAAGTAQQAQRRACNGVGKLRDGQHDNPLYTVVAVKRGRTLDIVDAARRQAGDGAGGLCPQNGQAKFSDVGLREAILHTNHRMVLTVLRGEGALRNHRYQQGRTLWTIKPHTVRPHP